MVLDINKKRETQKRWRDANPDKCKEYQRKWREKNAEHIREYERARPKTHRKREEHYEKKRISGAESAKSSVSYAIKTGRLPSLKENFILCVDCKKRATCYDHRDYNKPLDVQPVCVSCNCKRGGAIHLIRK